MSKTYIIAEAGVNHNGSLDLALQLIDAAALSGADAVKFQSFKASKLVSKHAPKADYQKRTTDTAESQLDMIRKLELSEQDHGTLIEHCQRQGIEFLSSPFDEDSLELLTRRFNLSRIKIPSGEMTNGPLLLKAAISHKPIILSTGMCTIGEIEAALGVLAYGYMVAKQPKQPSLSAFQQAYCSAEGQHVLREKVTLLHCTTEYPAPYQEVHLNAMETLRSSFGLQVGYSDHTEGIAIPIAAVARGAIVIEKHFTLDRNLPGPDHKASLEPNELQQMVQAIRQVELALGQSMKLPTASEVKNKEIARKRLVAAKTIKKGEEFTEDNLTMKRPGHGLSPMMYWNVLGQQSDQDYETDDPIR